MKRLVIRADDLGYTPGVNAGIAHAVAAGTVTAVEVMVTMPSAEDGLALVRDAGVSLDLHVNVSNGRPACPPSEVPSLVGTGGAFLPSSDHRAATREGRDLAALDDALREVRAQLDLFRSLVGRDPSCMGAHAVSSANVNAAIARVASEEGIRLFPLGPSAGGAVIGSTEVTVLPMLSSRPVRGYEEMLGAWLSLVESLQDDRTYVAVSHPGYVDAPLLASSSLTTNRAFEAEVLASAELSRALVDGGVELTGFSAL